MPLDLPFPFTLPRLFRSPAISNFFPFPLGLRNSGVRLYTSLQIVRNMQNSIETRGNLFTEPGPLVNNFLRLKVWREVYGFVIHW